MSRVLIVEDEEAIAEIEKDYLELSDFEVVIKSDGTQGLATALNEDFDIMILDVMLPGTDGYEICRQVREVKNTPIIMVSAKKEDIDKIRGLGVGADDYMTKPFSPSELVARVKAHLARYERLVSSAKQENDVIEIRGIKIDKTARRVFVNGEENDFRYSNLKIINPYFGVERIDKNGTEHYKVRIHIHGNITVGNYTNAIDAAIAYNKAVDLAHQAGISKNFPENYIEELSASSYADIYQQISLSPKYLSYLKGLPRK